MRPTTPTKDIDARRGHGAQPHPLKRALSARRRRRVTSGLGWFSIALGLSEVLAPASLGRAIGVGSDRRTRRIMRLMGAREIAVGVGILGAKRRAPWLWMRVAGDALDLALLRAATPPRWCREGRTRAWSAISAVAGVTAIDALAARSSSREEARPGAGHSARSVTAVVTIARPVDEVWAYFRDVSNLPSFMAHVESVEQCSDRVTRWRVRGPGGRTIQWDAEVVEEREGEILRWRSLPGGDVRNDGVVRFVPAPGGRGTEVHAKIRYRAPAGRLGVAIAKLFGREPGQQARGDLRRFKQVLETGGVMRSDASIHRGMHAARPTTQPNVEVESGPQLGQEIGR